MPLTGGRERNPPAASREEGSIISSTREHLPLEPDRTAALQQTIRSAGGTVARLRLWLWVGLGIALLLFALAGLLAYRAQVWLQHGKTVVAEFELACIGAWTVAAVIALPAAIAYRAARRARIVRQLAMLSPEQRASVVLPLRNSPQGDVRKLATSLMRTVGPCTELAPSSAPTGRGDEVATSGDP